MSNNVNEYEFLQLSLITGIFQDIILLTILAFIAIYLLIRYTFLYWAQHGVAYLAPYFPGGNINDLIFGRKTFGVVIKDLYDLVKNTCQHMGGIYLLSRPAILIVDPEVIKCVLDKDFEYFEDRELYYNGMHHPMAMLVDCPAGSKWSQTVHSKLTKLFADKKILNKLFVNFEMCTYNLINSFKNVNNFEVINVSKISYKYTVQIIDKCFLNLSELLTNESDIDVRSHVHFYPDTILLYLRDFILGIYSKLIPFDISYLLRNEKHKLRKIIGKLQSKHSITADDISNVLKDIFLATKQQQNRKITRNEIDNELYLLKLFEFFLNSFQTISPLLCFALFELSNNLKLQQQLRQEIQKNFTNFKEIKLELLLTETSTIFNRFFQELLRKYPINPVIERSCTKDYHVPNSKIIIRQGTLIFISIYGIHHDPKFYPNPNVFDIERFSSKFTENYLPFGMGTRKCLGEKFSMLPLKLAIIQLLNSYEVEKCSLTPEQVEFETKSYMLTPQQDIMLRIRKLE